ncbi:MAG: tRNA (adenosine(37)-N6)-dimethylallyltransferase MiaA, partial [Parcubacteria group bacterium]
MPKVKVLAIVGPTAAGKSALAVALAKRFGGEIISADSRQVYKGLDKGTGKITKREMAGVPHHLLDVADPHKQFSVSDFKTEADKALEAIEARKALPIVVGGTGLYVDTLAGLINLPDVGPNPLLRKKLRAKSAEELFQMLKKKDRDRAMAIDPRNKVRVIRALEIVEAIGKVPKIKSSPAKNFIYIGLKPDDLDEKIYNRLLERLPGIIREAKKLIKLKAISYRRMHELGLEYRYIGLYLRGKLSKE